MSSLVTRAIVSVLLIQTSFVSAGDDADPKVDSPSLWNRLTSCLQCPTTDDYSEECLIYALPPWPICLFHDANYFVAKSIDGASRCCQDDLTECRCPKKDSPKFLDQIGGWCKGVQACKKNNAEIDSTEGKVHDDGLDGVLDEDALEIPQDHVLYGVESTTGQEDVNAVRNLPAQSWADCPTTDGYTTECLQNAIPPYPICLRKTAQEWVDEAVNVKYNHCCSSDDAEQPLESCRCPQKNSPHFLNKISTWCAGVKSCQSEQPDAVQHEAAKYIPEDNLDGKATAGLRASNLEAAAEELRVTP